MVPRGSARHLRPGPRQHRGRVRQVPGGNLHRHRWRLHSLQRQRRYGAGRACGGGRHVRACPPGLRREQEHKLRAPINDDHLDHDGTDHHGRPEHGHPGDDVSGVGGATELNLQGLGNVLLRHGSAENRVHPRTECGKKLHAPAVGRSLCHHLHRAGDPPEEEALQPRFALHGRDAQCRWNGVPSLLCVDLVVDHAAVRLLQPPGRGQVLDGQ
mmetsp:Transcript_75911/g.246351  ORF Transcript_75911/g.246351 Transcript_75911/m.246351 type:complete len:213 (-) Transcript_75911:2055-2693(-)